MYCILCVCYCSVRVCLLSFDVETFVFQFAIHKLKYSDMQNYNFACCFVWVCRKWCVGVSTGSSWLRVGARGGHLWIRQWTFVFHKMRRISWLAENQSASQEGLCCVEWVSNLIATIFRLFLKPPSASGPVPSKTTTYGTIKCV